MHRSKWHVYSMTSLAMASSPGGKVRPNALAVLRIDHKIARCPMIRTRRCPIWA